MTNQTESKYLKKEELKAGLYLVATPIGNLADITFRALSVLSSVDYILCEDKRVSLKLLNYYGIENKLLSYHDHNTEKMIPKIIDLIAKGNSLALISDAGTPLLSDPGYKLVQKIIENEFYITSIPGASALLTGLTLSGLPMNNFYFAGFIPNKSSRRKIFYEGLKELVSSLIFYETANRLTPSLEDAKLILGDRNIAIGRELTKLYEEIIRGTISEVLDKIEKGEITLKGEIILMIEGAETKEISEDMILKLLKSELKTSSLRDASSKIAKKYQLSKKIVYNLALKLNK